MSEWISVKDMLPPIDEASSCYISINVLVVNKHRQFVAHYSPNDEMWFYSECCGCSVEGVTHWMQLPELPK